MTPETKSTGLRGGALDAMRFAAAMLIVLYHYGSEAPTPLDSISNVFARGYLATDFFLMLSGFVLGRAYGKQVAEARITVPAFFKKRVERVWPGQLIVLFGLLALWFAATVAGVAPRHPENYSKLSLAMQTLLVQAWGVPGGGGWNEPSWSLSALVVCYAAFPFIWRAVSRIQNPLNVLALGLNVAIVSDIVCMLVLKHRLWDLPLQFGVVRALPLFLLGACLARLVDQNLPSVQFAKNLAIASVVALVLLQLSGRFDVLSIVCVAAIVLSFGRLPVMNPSPLIERGAKLSFALFITHSFTGMAFWGVTKVLKKKLELGPGAEWALWALSIPAALVVAWAFDAYIDEPIQKFLAKRRKAKAAAAAPAPVVAAPDAAS